MSIKCCEHSAPPKGMIGPRVSRAAKMLRNRFNEAANSEGLFSGQHHIIILLKKNEGLTLGQLAQSLNITPATASVSIKRMEKAGFIEKRPDENDARVTRLYLTEKGNAVTDNIKERMAVQEGKITNGFTKEEILVLSDLLDRLIQNMEKEEKCDD